MNTEQPTTPQNHVYANFEERTKALENLIRKLEEKEVEKVIPKKSLLTAALREIAIKVSFKINI